LTRSITGTFYVMVTPFKENEDLDLVALRANIDFYIQRGVHGLVVGGSTGEFAALTPEEHMEIIKVAVDQRNVPCSTSYSQNAITKGRSNFTRRSCRC
jgi:4-hydroxy-tetrahydrodipicolinate synthase